MAAPPPTGGAAIITRIPIRAPGGNHARRTPDTLRLRNYVSNAGVLRVGTRGAPTLGPGCSSQHERHKPTTLDKIKNFLGAQTATKFFGTLGRSI